MNTRILDGFDGVKLEHVPIIFDIGTFRDVFSGKNNKSLAETLEHQRYAKLSKEANARYAKSLHEPLGQFLSTLKHHDDQFYIRFLNRYGDLLYSRFRISGAEFLDKKGVYAYFVDDRLVYIGRCRDSMKKRIDQGYGKIHPKNCYIDGQATNCHLNAKITKVRGKVSLWLHSLEASEEIENLERCLIRNFQPEWNIQRS